jgi:hypothetical protein
MIRWGTVVVFGVIMLFFVSWFVKYPDVITGSKLLLQAFRLKLVAKRRKNPIYFD